MIGEKSRSLFDDDTGHTTTSNQLASRFGSGPAFPARHLGVFPEGRLDPGARPKAEQHARKEKEEIDWVESKMRHVRKDKFGSRRGKSGPTAARGFFQQNPQSSRGVLFSGMNARVLGLTLWASMGIGCAPAAPQPSTPPNGPDEPLGPPAAPSPPETPSSTKTEPPSALPRPVSCENAVCSSFESPAAAVHHLLTQHSPRVIGWGEAHTPRGFTGRSTVQRFTEEILPTLASRTSALVLELLAPPNDPCAPEREAVEREAEAITEGQAESNQSDYLKLGARTRELGAIPDILRTSCEELRAISDAGELAVLVMMETIANLTTREVKHRLSRATEERPLVLAYGGALHNDLSPREGRESWSYGPRVDELTASAYLEIDLVLPELVRDTESWRAFTWYAPYQSTPRAPASTLLIQTGPRTYALILPADSAEQTALDQAQHQNEQER